MLTPLLVFLWSTLWALLSVRKMTKGGKSLTHPVLLVIYVFLALPLLYDLLWGRPDLTRYPGLEIAQNDDRTNSLYVLYVFIIFPVFYFFAQFRANPNKDLQLQRGRLHVPEPIKLLCVVLLVSPIILVLFSPDPAIYSEFGLASRSANTEEFRDFHSIVALFARLSSLAAVVLILSAKRVSPGFVFTILAFMVAASWIHSKRSAVALMLVFLVYAFWQRGLLRGKRLISAGVAALIGLGVYSMVYQAEVRGESEVATSYEGFRMDYGRDASIKLAVYSMSYPEDIHVMEPFETIPLYAGQLIPREWWPEKPYPYAVYVTSAIFLQPPQLWGWGITTSWFGEWLSNIGWSAFFVAPALLGILCRLGNRVKSALPRVTVTVVLILLVVQHVAAFSFFVPIALIAGIWDVGRNRKKARLEPKNVVYTE